MDGVCYIVQIDKSDMAAEGAGSGFVFFSC